MSTSLSNEEMNEIIFQEVREELNRQQQLAHNGNTEENDKTNTQNDWVATMSAYIGRAADKVYRNQREGQTFRENMKKAIAVAVSAIRAHDKGYC
jgi:hypothetical protein